MAHKGKTETKAGDTIRAFIAISLPETMLHRIAQVQDSLRQASLDIRWTRPEGIHLTLKFLGNIQTGSINDIKGAMEKAAEKFPPLLLWGQGVGAFPNLHRPRVLWAGLSGDLEPLCGLQQRLDSKLKKLGFPKETRKFKGHLTLGRAKGPIDPDALRNALENIEEFKTDSFEAKSIELFQSELKPGGAVYTEVEQVPLGIIRE